MMALTAAEKAQCVEWFIQTGKSVVAFQRKFRKQHGIHSNAPDKKQIKLWYQRFMAGEGTNRKKKNEGNVRDNIFLFFLTFQHWLSFLSL